MLAALQIACVADQGGLVEQERVGSSWCSFATCTAAPNTLYDRRWGSSFRRTCYSPDNTKQLSIDSVNITMWTRDIHTVQLITIRVLERSSRWRTYQVGNATSLSVGTRRTSVSLTVADGAGPYSVAIDPSEAHIDLFYSIVLFDSRNASQFWSETGGGGDGGDGSDGSEGGGGGGDGFLSLCMAPPPPPLCDSGDASASDCSCNCAFPDSSPTTHRFRSGSAERCTSSHCSAQFSDCPDAGSHNAGATVEATFTTLPPCAISPPAPPCGGADCECSCCYAGDDVDEGGTRSWWYSSRVSKCTNHSVSYFDTATSHASDYSYDSSRGAQVSQVARMRILTSRISPSRPSPSRLSPSHLSPLPSLGRGALQR